MTIGCDGDGINGASADAETATCAGCVIYVDGTKGTHAQVKAQGLGVTKIGADLARGSRLQQAFACDSDICTQGHMVGIKNIVLTGCCAVPTKAAAALRKREERHFVGAKSNHLFRTGSGAVFARGAARQARGGDPRRAHNHAVGMPLGTAKKIASVKGLIRHQMPQ
ncbi:hypothetical protein NBRC116601_00970 [Cognatishimia sp. WU-CL00825]